MKEYRHCQPLFTHRKRGREERRRGAERRAEMGRGRGEKERGRGGRHHIQLVYTQSSKCWLNPGVTVWNQFIDSKYVRTVWFAHDERYNKVRQLYYQHSLLHFNESRLLQSGNRAGDERVVKTFSHLFHHNT
jgi:hypothetical protein